MHLTFLLLRGLLSSAYYSDLAYQLLYPTLTRWRRAGHLIRLLLTGISSKLSQCKLFVVAREVELTDRLVLIFIVLEVLQIIGTSRAHENMIDIGIFVNAVAAIFSLSAGIMCVRLRRHNVRMFMGGLACLIAISLLILGIASDVALADTLLNHGLQIISGVGMVIIAISLANRCRFLRRENLIQEEQQNELTRFLAVASHDLRQPMHALNIYLGSLINIDLPEEAKPLLDKVCLCANIMDEMFLALLDLSKLNAQVVQPHIVTFPIMSVLTRLEVEFTPQARAKGLDFAIEPTVLWAESDPALVEQILRNLIANAVRYTETGRIDISCGSSKGKAHIAIRDTGVGISVQQQQTVFEEFFQITNTNGSRGKGLGLGLAIVRRLCKLLGSSINLVSESGKGSTFTLDLPLKEAPIENAVLQPVTAERDQGFLKDKLILVVENEGSIRDAMRTLLEQRGCAVVTAASTGEAITTIAAISRLPDAIICDYRLNQHETGLDVINNLHEKFSEDISAMLITGDTEQEVIQELLSSGFIVMYKPVRAEMLLDVLSYMLQ